MGAPEMRYKLIAFDMDGTLLPGDSCWRIIHKHFNVKDVALKNLRDYDEGKIDYPEFMRRDIALWQPPPTLADIKKIYGGVKLAPQAGEVVREILERGYRVAIITGGMDFVANKAAKKLGTDLVVANGIETDATGRLTGRGIFRVDPKKKDKILQKLAARLGFTLSECVAVGDGKYDASFLKSAGLGVAINGDEELKQVADVVIENFKNFSQLLDYI
jgi:phosphoserine phosphatase